MVARPLRGYLMLVAVFALGAAAGGTSVFAVLKHRSTAMLVDDRVNERRLDGLTDELGLDGAQRQQIAAILNQAQGEARAISWQTDARCGHPLLDHRTQVDDRIRAALRGEQQARFDALLTLRRERETSRPTPSSAPP
jgi:Spy/CpxP family protein refolding chaperone